MSGPVLLTAVWLIPVVTVLATLGLPGLSGFVAEVTIFIGAFANAVLLNRVCTVLAVLSIVVTAVYVLQAANAVFSGPLRAGFRGLSDATLMEKLPVILLLVAIFGMGLLPAWIVELVNGAVDPVYNQIAH